MKTKIDFNKLFYRASHRGIREMDIVLGRYCKAHMKSAHEVKLQTFSLVLSLDDQPMFQALSENSPEEAFHVLVSVLPVKFHSSVIAMLHEIHQWMRDHPYRGG